MPGESRAAVRQAREVVGLYGDPDATWGIAAELRLTHSLDPSRVAERLRELTVYYPHLGRPGQVRVVPAEQWAKARVELAAEPYAGDGPLVRIGLATDGSQLMVAAHHGVCDGLGLLAIANRLGELGLVVMARGIGGKAAEAPFWRASARRVTEALLRPPPRLHGSTRLADSAGLRERLLTAELPAQVGGTAAFCLAVAQVFAQPDASARPVKARPPLLVVGASRRDTQPEPDRATAFFRYPVDPSWNLEQTQAALKRLYPEPDFPETSAWGIGPAVTRLLRGRLGSTAQVSNLGVIAGTAVESVAMFPSLNGPWALSFGLATTELTTTVTLRTRTSEFDSEHAGQLLSSVSERFVEIAAGR